MQQLSQHEYCHLKSKVIKLGLITLLTHAVGDNCSRVLCHEFDTWPANRGQIPAVPFSESNKVQAAYLVANTPSSVQNSQMHCLFISKSQQGTNVVICHVQELSKAWRSPWFPLIPLQDCLAICGKLFVQKVDCAPAPLSMSAVHIALCWAESYSPSPGHCALEVCMHLRPASLNMMFDCARLL